MKTINGFVIHVNADHPEEVDFAFKLAVEYRQKFQRDVMIDVVGYRRLGHNEHDSPKFTQPKVYSQVDTHPKLAALYGHKLIDDGIFKKEEIDTMYKKWFDELTQSYEIAKAGKYVENERPPSLWAKYLGSWKDPKHGKLQKTSITKDDFKRIGTTINTLPEGNNFYSIVQKSYEARLKSIETGTGVDWATAESLAFGSLIDSGYGVRLSGEDVKRGTFTQRHAVLVDQKDFTNYYPLNRLEKKDSPFRFKVYNSFLSEYGVVGFDYGYSIGNPDYLTMWEAQFGDFSNVAQPIIDLYITNGEVKWGLKSGLTLLLPHGLDGQGPEHSSSRVERYLQMVDDDYRDPEFISDDDRQLRLCNYSICNISEPANYFHVLRRQLLRDYRKPLVVLTPKRLLRLKEAKSDMKDFTEISGFRTMLGDGHPEDTVAPKDAKKLYICTGQFYYELIEKRRASKRTDIGIIRLEQLAPFPFVEMQKHLEKYSNAQVFWVQEEPENQAYWTFVRDRLNVVLKKLKKPEVNLISRKPAAASAPGSTTTHKKQQEELLSLLFKN